MGILQWPCAEFVGHLHGLDTTCCLQPPPHTLGNKMFCLWGASRNSNPGAQLLTNHSRAKDISHSSRRPAQWLPSHLKCHCMCYKVVFPLPPQNVKLLKGSSGTRASLWHSQNFFLLTWSWGCSACFPWKLINNTKAFFSPILWSIISLWPMVPGNFHIFNNHKYATHSIYFEQKKKSQIKVKELLSSWNQTPLGMQITYCNLLLAEPLVSSVDEILSPRQQLSRGTQTNEKIFIVLAFQMARKEEGALTDHCPWN